MSTSGLSATSPRREIRALYVTSFPTKSYRRPVMAARALNLLGIHSIIVEGWRVVEAHKPARLVASLSRFFPTPLNWISRDVAYEAGLLAAARSLRPELWINLNVVGALALRRAAPEGRLILDIQDFTIQDDYTVPFYDAQTLRNSTPDLLILTSRAIVELLERRYPKLVRRAEYIPFGIDLTSFDKHYSEVSPSSFREYLKIGDRPLLVYTGAAYLWGNREGQGLGLMLEAVKRVRRENPGIRLVIQGAASPGSEVYRWIVSRVKNLGLTNCCTLLPPTDPYDPLRMSMLKASDILLLPIGDILGTYLSEQLKLYEYMAAARPIVMVSTPARLNVLGESEAHISRRDPEDFAAQIINALKDREEAAARALRARKLVEARYDWVKLAPLYAEAISRATGLAVNA